MMCCLFNYFYLKVNSFNLQIQDVFHLGLDLIDFDLDYVFYFIVLISTLNGSCFTDLDMYF